MGYLLVMIGAIATVSADWFAKTWSMERHWWLFAVAVGLYSTTGAMFTYSLSFGKLTVLNALWSVFIFLSSTVLGMVVFREEVSSLQKAALVLGFLSVVLFSVAEVT